MELQSPRNTPMRDGDVLVLGIETGRRIFAGALVAINPQGYAVPGTEDSSIRGLGRAESNVDNISGAHGDVTVGVRKGVFRFNNHDADTVTMADVGCDCYIVDDQTVANRGKGFRGVAGKVFDVDSTGVWVRFQ